MNFLSLLSMKHNKATSNKQQATSNQQQGCEDIIHHQTITHIVTLQLCSSISAGHIAPLSLKRLEYLQLCVRVTHISAYTTLSLHILL